MTTNASGEGRVRTQLSMPASLLNTSKSIKSASLSKNKFSRSSSTAIAAPYQKLRARGGLKGRNHSTLEKLAPSPKNKQYLYV